MGKLLRGLASLLLLIAFVGFMAWTQSWTVRGFVAAQLWDKKSTFECAGNLVVTLRGVSVSLPQGAQPAKDLLMPAMHFGSCEKEKGGCPIIYAAGNCELEIIDSTLAAPHVLHAGGNAKIVIRNSKLLGKIDRGGSAEISGLPEEDRKTATEQLSRKFGSHACDGVVECYRQAGAFGNISGRLSVTIAADGHAAKARYENGEAPAAVRTCLISLGQEIKLSAYDGKPGLLTCDYAGSLTPGTMMMNTTPAFSHMP